MRRKAFDITGPIKSRDRVNSRVGRDFTARDRFIGGLHADGVSIIDAIKQVRSRFGLSLGDAKRFVSTHLAWEHVSAASAPLQREFERVIAKAAAERRSRSR